MTRVSGGGGRSRLSSVHKRTVSNQAASGDSMSHQRSSSKPSTKHLSLSRRGSDTNKLFPRYNSHLLTSPDLIRVIASHLLFISTIGAGQWTCIPKEKQRLLYAILRPRITSSLSELVIDRFGLNLIQEWSRFDLSDHHEIFDCT
jgi:hypothetical protein